jgi:hypothetical protein
MRKLVTGTSLLSALLLGACGAEDNSSASGEEAQATIGSLTENSERHEGLFTVFVDRETGATRMLLEADQTGAEFIYVATVIDAPTITGQFRGNLGEWTKNGVIRLRRHFDRVEFVEQNVNFYFDPDNPLSRASGANISPAVIAVAKIEAEDEETGQILVDVAPAFLSEAFVQLKPSPDPNSTGAPRFDMGTLSETKTRLTHWRSYPENVDIQVEYVYENPAPVVEGGDDVTDSRYISVKLQHSFIAMPGNGFQPRAYDPRVGYYHVRVTDLTSDAAAPWLDYINRWDLRKKDPGAAVSEPVEPIVFWIENTTPHEYRDSIREGVLAWNKAFEQAGFSNAIQVAVQPDDAEWDAGDIRYNVIRWAASPNPVFGGFGPVVVNPRTSQIIGADIMLEQTYMTYQRVYTQLFGGGQAASARALQFLCDMPLRLQAGMQLGRVAMKAGGGGPAQLGEMSRQGLKSLVMHEVGHTLGLNHNFMGSQLYAPDELYGAAATSSGYTLNSVMDYAPINVAPKGQEQGLYYETDIGPYDRWAIEYGYAEALDDAAAEKKRNAQLLSLSSKPEYWFANDADDMRSAGSGIDPRAMIGDMSNDAIRYATGRMQLVRDLLDTLVDDYREEGASYQDLVAAWTSLTGQYETQAKVISRYVGGVYVDRSVQGQPGASNPYTPVPREEQRRAMAGLHEFVFGPEALTASDVLYRHLQAQRRGFDFYGSTEDPKIHDRALATQKSVLDHLLHPVVMKRLTDSALYGNEYEVADMITELTAAIFAADMARNVNSMRQNLQADYVSRLVSIVAPGSEGGYDQPSRAMALYSLQDLRSKLAAQQEGDLATRAHRAALISTIDRALERS